jgi:hypothetical protein
MIIDFVGWTKMLAKELVENSLLRFITSEAPNIDTDGVPLSQLVSRCSFELKYSLFCSSNGRGMQFLSTHLCYGVPARLVVLSTSSIRG